VSVFAAGRPALRHTRLVAAKPLGPHRFTRLTAAVVLSSGPRRRSVAVRLLGLKALRLIVVVTGAATGVGLRRRPSGITSHARRR
jgi:hypothetical protein